MKQGLLVACFFLLLGFSAKSQDYHAIQGSSYAGSLGVQNNPASAVNTPYKWDVTLLGAQATTSTNLLRVVNYSYLSSPANSLWMFRDGEYARKANVAVNLNLLNARIALNRKSTISFGANLRSYSNGQTVSYNYSDTIQRANDFLKVNQGLIHNASAKVFSSTWLEGYLSYARTLSDNEFGRLNAGVTLKVSKGLSGGYTQAGNITFSQATGTNPPQFTVNSANISYAYSANYDHWQDANSTGQNIKNMFSYAQGGASIDAGIEYIIKPQDLGNDDDDSYYDYDWKVGVSLLDIGANRYKYGTQSRVITGTKGAISGQTLENKFPAGMNTLREFNDSLSTIATGDQPFGDFTVFNPMRLVINIDRYLTGNFYLNGELSVGVPVSSINKSYLQVKTINLLTITPRWERRMFGFYLPVQYNTQNQLWIGGAFKAGPLLFGLHNLVNLFSKTSTQNGGGYIALVFRASGGTHTKGDKRLDCPKPIF